MLFGTRELWQTTDRTAASGARTDGSGSRRRAAEFVVRPDDFKDLGRGEAVVWTTLGPKPEQVLVTPGPTLDLGAVSSRSFYQPVPINKLAAAVEQPNDPARKAAPKRAGGHGPAGDLFGDW